MATPSRRPPVEVLTLASWVAVIGSAELKSDDGRSHFCSGCQRVGIDVDELLFSDGEPPLDFALDWSSWYPAKTRLAGSTEDCGSGPWVIGSASNWSSEGRCSQHGTP